MSVVSIPIVPRDVSAQEEKRCVGTHCGLLPVFNTGSGAGAKLSSG